MPHLRRKSFATPDEVRAFLNGRIDIVTLGEMAIGRFVFRPGWRWSQDVAPIVGTRSCQHRHVGYTISGSAEVQMDDGTRLVIGPDDAYEIPPGHDAWVVGDVPWDSVEFTSVHEFGLSPEELGERVLATILSSDIVASTETLARIGDRAWAQLLNEHNATQPAYFTGYAYVAMNAVALGRLDEARAAIVAGRQVRPDLSLALIQGYFGVSRPAFDARRDAALRQAGLE